MRVRLPVHKKINHELQKLELSLCKFRSYVDFEKEARYYEDPTRGRAPIAMSNTRWIDRHE